jgi:hypothetical protein
MARHVAVARYVGPGKACHQIDFPTTVSASYLVFILADILLRNGAGPGDGGKLAAAHVGGKEEASKEMLQCSRSAVETVCVKFSPI